MAALPRLVETGNISFSFLSSFLLLMGLMFQFTADTDMKDATSAALQDASGTATPAQAEPGAPIGEAAAVQQKQQQQAQSGGGGGKNKKKKGKR